jgi:hypothetical protein
VALPASIGWRSDSHQLRQLRHFGRYPPHLMGLASAGQPTLRYVPDGSLSAAKIVVCIRPPGRRSDKVEKNFPSADAVRIMIYGPMFAQTGGRIATHVKALFEK